MRRIVYSSNEMLADAGSALLVAAKEHAHRRKKFLKMRHEAIQFIEIIAKEEREAERAQELENYDEFTASGNNFIV